MPNTVGLKPAWQPGQSGNPGGRPKGIAAKAREHTDRALEVLREGMEDADPRVRVTAAKEILDRGWGKPLTMSADVTKRLDQFDDEQLDAAIAVLESVVGAGRPDGVEAGEAGATAH